ncbi:FecR family protein [Pedobacter sp. ok626]|uniref:FecR family protein n=1 Tax=Pedobacter sp. ok626 TaxID=1761882 RepID=UPI000B87A06B|nr:FecR domain-containing protein [Pedobacter sp. ok626]
MKHTGMFEHEFDMALLFSAHVKGELDAQGQKQLNAWLNASQGNRELFDSLMHKEELKKKLISFNEGNSEIIWGKTLQSLVTLNIQEDHRNIFTAKNQTVKLWKRISIAVSIIIALSVGGYFFIKGLNYFGSDQQIVLTINDNAPGRNRATLTLANGKAIALSDTKTGLVVGLTDLTYNDGSYIDVKQENQLLTASTPRGGTYQITLSDGTRVWLNANSKLIFPSKFSPSQRKVQLIGEAYFEVAKVMIKDSRMPFVVVTDQQEISVLGTHFNLNSYKDEGVAKTTLLEGSVKVSLLSSSGKARAIGSVILGPGQEAVLNKNSELKVTAADVEQATAWKNGLFYFKDADLKTILRTFSRWYDIDIVYTGSLSSQKFSGKLYRNVNAYQALEVLKLLGLDFVLEKKNQQIPQKIIIKP